jgi:hypothetical protein
MCSINVRTRRLSIIPLWLILFQVHQGFFQQRQELSLLRRPVRVSQGDRFPRSRAPLFQLFKHQSIIHAIVRDRDDLGLHVRLNFADPVNLAEDALACVGAAATCHADIEQGGGLEQRAGGGQGGRGGREGWGARKKTRVRTRRPNKTTRRRVNMKRRAEATRRRARGGTLD